MAHPKQYSYSCALILWAAANKADTSLYAIYHYVHGQWQHTCGIPIHAVSLKGRGHIFCMPSDEQWMVF